MEAQKHLAESQSQFELTFLRTELAEYREKYETILQENERICSEAIVPLANPATAPEALGKTAAIIDFVDWNHPVDTKGKSQEEDYSEDGWSNFGFGEPEVVEEPIIAKKQFLTHEVAIQAGQHDTDREKE